MNKRETVLPMKGIRTPRFLIWLRGLLHGKVLHTGGLDPATDTISSGYITGQTKRFRNACIARREKAEGRLNKFWTEADQLLIEYSAVPTLLTESGNSQKSYSEASAWARANERATDKRQTILKDMANISNAIRTEYNEAHDQMEATAEILLSTFSCYGHGLLMKPIFEYNLPTINYEDCAKQILTNHEHTWNAIETIIKEELK